MLWLDKRTMWLMVQCLLWSVLTVCCKKTTIDSNSTAFTERIDSNSTSFTERTYSNFTTNLNTATTTTSTTGNEGTSTVSNTLEMTNATTASTVSKSPKALPITSGSNTDQDPANTIIMDRELVRWVGEVQMRYPSIDLLGRQKTSSTSEVTSTYGECEFGAGEETTLCEWIPLNTSALRWEAGSGATAYVVGGPLADHTENNAVGGYAFVETSVGGFGSVSDPVRAPLESSVLNKTGPEGRCLQFWYNIGGLSADQLRVLLVPLDDNAVAQARFPRSSILWEAKDPTDEQWILAEFLYSMNVEHKIIFEALAKIGTDPTRNYRGHVAIDDVVFDGADSCMGFCTFEGGLCGWENWPTDDDFDWTQGRGSLSRLTGPPRDHGEGVGGGYLYIDSSYPRRPGDMARLASPQLPPTGDVPVCFKFWTHMFGNGIGTLRVIYNTRAYRKVIWEISGESGNAWHMGQITVSSDTKYQILLEGVIGRNSLGDIAVDDLTFSSGPCPSSPQSAMPVRGDCTFEADECGWTNSMKGDQFDWTRATAANTYAIGPPAPPQGPMPPLRIPEPLGDHTTGLSSGTSSTASFFLSMERGNIPPRSGDQAYIVSPIVEGSKRGSCFAFWAFMHERAVDTSGPGLGSLTVYIRTENARMSPIWRMTNYEHPAWFFAQTPIRYPRRFQIMIAGTWGTTRLGTIAVDDFTFYDGSCKVMPPQASVTPGECTFDTNLCDWTIIINSTGERNAWQLASPQRRPSNLDDHTYRASSGYAFFDLFGPKPSSVKLESIGLGQSGNSSDSDNIEANQSEEPEETENMDNPRNCLTFWFAPFGSSRATELTVLHQPMSSETSTLIWKVTMTSFQTFRPDWMYAQVPVDASSKYKIIFEGTSNNGGFALDDVKFITGDCKVRPAEGNPK